MKEFPTQPNFEKRKEFAQLIKLGTRVRVGDKILRNVSVDNTFFPNWLYGINDATGASETIRLQEDILPTILNRSEAAAATAPPLTRRNQQAELEDDHNIEALHKLVEVTGDPMLGILVKLNTKKGMSSQLIARWDAKKRGEIQELLPGEEMYERTRHDLHIFYQTTNYCDLPESVRDQAIEQMRDLGNIEDENARQEAARKTPIFGLNAPKSQL